MTLRLMVGIALVALLAGCRGGGGAKKTSESASPTDAAAEATATPASLIMAPFDVNKLTALVLRPEDVPSGLRAVGGWNPSGPDIKGVSFSTFYGENDLYIQSTVGYYPNDQDRDEGFDHIRRGIAGITGGEKNYSLPGADLGFSYQGLEPPTTSVLVFKDNYFVLLSMMSRDGSHKAEVLDRTNIDKYTSIVWERVQNFLANPDAVTPIPGAAKYGATPDAGAATPAPTP